MSQKDVWLLYIALVLFVFWAAARGWLPKWIDGIGKMLSYDVSRVLTRPMNWVARVAVAGWADLKLLKVRMPRVSPRAVLRFITHGDIARPVFDFLFGPFEKPAPEEKEGEGPILTRTLARGEYWERHKPVWLLGMEVTAEGMTASAPMNIMLRDGDRLVFTRTGGLFYFPSVDNHEREQRTDLPMTCDEVKLTYTTRQPTEEQRQNWRQVEPPTEQRVWQGTYQLQRGSFWTPGNASRVHLQGHGWRGTVRVNDCIRFRNDGNLVLSLSDGPDEPLGYFSGEAITLDWEHNGSGLRSATQEPASPSSGQAEPPRAAAASSASPVPHWRPVVVLNFGQNITMHNGDVLTITFRANQDLTVQSVGLSEQIMEGAPEIGFSLSQALRFDQGRTLTHRSLVLPGPDDNTTEGTIRVRGDVREMWNGSEWLRVGGNVYPTHPQGTLPSCPIRWNTAHGGQWEFFMSSLEGWTPFTNEVCDDWTPAGLHAFLQAHGVPEPHVTEAIRALMTDNGVLGPAPAIHYDRMPAYAPPPPPPPAVVPSRARKIEL